jgi:hypothetical protein
VFFAGKKIKDKPFQKLFIIPKRFDINASYYDEDSDLPKRYSNDAACPINNVYGTAKNPSVHNDTCFAIVSIPIHLNFTGIYEHLLIGQGLIAFYIYLL